MFRFLLIAFAAVGLPSHVPVVGERGETEEFEDTTLLQSHRVGRSTATEDTEGCKGPQPVIIDTDMDTDDQMAIAYLLAEPSIVVKAITVLADGWSNQWSGVVNAMRLTQYFGQPDIPVAYSPKYNSDTQLNLQEPNGLPKISLLPGINNYLSEFVPLPFNERPPSWQYASTLIARTLKKSRCKVDIIELGPLTTLAQVIQEYPKRFKTKVKRLYFSGGEISPRNVEPTTKVWPYSAGGTSFTGKPPGTSWNVFSDPIAANAVFSFGVRMVFATSTLQNSFAFSTNDTSYIPASCDPQRAQFLRDLVDKLPDADAEKQQLIKYWDQSAAVLAVQMIRNNGAEDAAVCTKWNRTTFSVMMEAGDNPSVSGTYYARLLENSFGQHVTECLAGNETEFLIAYYSGLCGIFYQSTA